MTKVVAVENTELADTYLAKKVQLDLLEAEVQALRDEIVRQVGKGTIIKASNGKVANVSNIEKYNFDVAEALPLIRRRKLDLNEVLSVRAGEFRKLVGNAWKTVGYTVSSSPRLTFGKPK